MKIAAMEEVAAVALAVGVELANDILAHTVAFIDAVAPGATSSMQRDIPKGTRSELMAQTGVVVRLGEEVGCPTPVSRFLFHGLLPLELRSQGDVGFESS